MADEFDERRLTVDRSPLQHPDRDRLVRRVTYGGPDHPLDARIILSQQELESLLNVAKDSMTRRAVLHHAGVSVALFETTQGHRYEVWSLIGSTLSAE